MRLSNDSNDFDRCQIVSEDNNTIDLNKFRLPSEIKSFVNSYIKIEKIREENLGHYLAVRA